LLADTGSGGIISDCNKTWITSFYSFAGSGDIIKAENMGLIHGLTIAWNTGLRQLQCETDNQPIVEV